MVNINREDRMRPTTVATVGLLTIHLARAAEGMESARKASLMCVVYKRGHTFYVPWWCVICRITRASRYGKRGRKKEREKRSQLAKYRYSSLSLFHFPFFYFSVFLL